MRHTCSRLHWMRRFARLGVALLLLVLVLPLLPTPAALAAPTCVVANLNDSSAGSLRQCLIDIDTGGTITFQADLTGAITAATALPTLTKAVTVIGPGVGRLSIDPDFFDFPGGAFIVDSGGNLTVSGLTLTGGLTGVYILPGGIASLTNMDISGNIDAGVVAEDSSATLRNVTLSANDTGLRVLGNGNANLGNVTISGNTFGVRTADNGVAILSNVTLRGNDYGLFNPEGSTQLTNTIVADSTSTNCSATAGSGGHNLDTGATCGFGSANGNKSNTASGLDSSGLLNNGGPTRTIRLNPGSAALDAGDDTACTQGGANGIDQRGFSRTTGAGGHCDIGAFERAAATCLVTSSDDSGAGTLRDCLIAREVSTITVQAQGTITLVSNLPSITDGVTINGPGANLLTIDRGSTQTGTTVFTIATDGFLTASRLTLTGAAIGILVSSSSTAALNNMTFSNNSIGLQVAGGDATVMNTTFSDNDNGVFIQSGTAMLANVTLASNTIRGMSVAAGIVALTNATVAGNGTGIERSGGTVVITNTIVADNSSANCSGSVNNAGNNLDTGTTCFTGNANGNKSNTPAGLSPNGLQFNGGQTQTVALLSNSSAVGAGSNASCGQTGAGKVNGVDQRGVVRPQGAVCDMGAFELTNAACTVTSLADSGAGTLRTCLDPAEITTITFQAGLTGNITLTSNLPTLARAVTLTGPGASLITINRNNLNSLESVITVGNSGNLTVSGLTLVGAETGIWVQTGGSATVTDVVFNGNIYGLWTDGTSVSVTNTTASGNNYGLVVTVGTARVTGATFAGGIDGVLTSGGTTSLTNATLTSNAAGVFVAAGTVTLTNVTVANNTEGIHRDAGSATLINTIVAENTNANCSGTVISGGHNLDSGITCGFGSANGNKSNIPAGLSPNGLQSNGGPTQTIALLLSSAALDAGADNSCTLPGAGNVNSVDQRGTARPQGSHCDIGAFELVYIPATLNTGTTGTGTGNISPATGSYLPGTVVTVSANPNGGSSFIGWMVDSVYAGWASSLTITMDVAHTVQAIFAPTKTFTADVPSGHLNAEAITELASRGNILGYDSTHYGPGDPVQRAQMAVLIARATPLGPGTPTNGTLTPPGCTVARTWDCEDWGTTFTDRGGVPASLWRAAGTLQHYGVAFGYTQQDCANKGRAFPCYGPTDPVSYAQTIAFISRAMIAKGYWVAQPNAPLPGGNVPSVLATPIRTFAFYTGGIPNAPADWNAGASRGWFAEALWAALDSYWGTDGNLPDGRPAGGNIP